jgi:uncharacterized OsmC-like protein
MVKMLATYQGEKHCEVIHQPSNSIISTDAPRDNHGKGETFSPTDLIGAAMATCMLTTMAILSEKDSIDLTGAQISIGKEMTTNPRRIGELSIILRLPRGIPEDHRTKIEGYALNCPVARSLHPDLKIPVDFIYDI